MTSLRNNDERHGSSRWELRSTKLKSVLKLTLYRSTTNRFEYLKNKIKQQLAQ